MTCSKITTFSLIIAAASLSACTTVKMPSMDILKTLGFEGEAKNLGEYPDIANTPKAPEDVRSAALWDAEAVKLIRKRDMFGSDEISSAEPVKSDAELAREAAALRAKVRAYKADDPQ